MMYKSMLVDELLPVSKVNWKEVCEDDRCQNTEPYTISADQGLTADKS